MRSIKKVYLSLLTLILTAMIFVTVSYAWISLNTINNIDGLTLTASSGDELEMSIDGVNFYNALPASEVESLFREMKLYDVTSMDGVTFQTGGLRGSGEAIRNEHYLSFDLWLRTTEKEKHVFLVNHQSQDVTFENSDQATGTYIVSQGVYWLSDLRFYNGPTIDDLVVPGDFAKYYGADAVRISFVELIDETNELDERTEEDLRVFLFDPSNNPNRGFGTLYGQYSYFQQRAQIYLPIPNTFPNTSYRLSAIDPFDPYQALDNESWIATLQPTEALNDNDEVYYQAKIRVNLWVEGWDADAFDAIDRDILKIQLQFKVLNKAQ